MRLMDANEGDILERGSERVVIVSVKLSRRRPEERNFVTYRRVDGDSNRVYTARGDHDDASEPAHHAANDWTRVRPATRMRLVDANEGDVPGASRRRRAG